MRVSSTMRLTKEDLQIRLKAAGMAHRAGRLAAVQ
ncbi:hypothetical protein EGR_09944 [Echinococcus granulosus]|uniref:Uncharacterized protein n=1 Tax=Echinococcus granulosus TaxID=6210 RepID=W6U2B3_ECHGR|nr:hypothetical protein EGR_09944 [Echinococcus granulosus]EUB55203.1 hypothetical protein EGR_09944 [Echinococcus granulosus]